jgi:hypothetical protein
MHLTPVTIHGPPTNTTHHPQPQPHHVTNYGSLTDTNHHTHGPQPTT